MILGKKTNNSRKRKIHWTGVSTFSSYEQRTSRGYQTLQNKAEMIEEAYQTLIKDGMRFQNEKKDTER